MDSEGSDLDELADLDLATFAARDSDMSAQLKPTDSDSDDHQLTETDDNSLGDSMDSRANSDVMRVSEISDAAKEIVQGVVKPQSLASEHGTCLDREIQEEDFSANTKTSFSSVGTGAEAEQTADTNVLQDSGFDGSLLVSDRLGFSQHYVSLERLPGENLGMVLAIEGDQDNRRPVEAVLVRSVTPGGAASRAGGGGTSIQVGDEVREVDGRPLTELTHDQCITLFQDMPDNVVLTIHRASRQEQHSPGQSVSGQHKPGAAVSPAPPVPRPRGSVSRAGMLNMEEMVVGADNSTPRLDEDDGFVRTPRGFVKLDLTVFRGEGDSLGLSIVPSHGATCDLYQVKRLLPGGACAESGCLEVHDRLLSCNGLSLKGLTQAQCLQVLKSSGHFVELTVLRQIDASLSQHSLEREEAPADSVDHPAQSAGPSEVAVADGGADLQTDIAELVPEEGAELHVSDTQHSVATHHGDSLVQSDNQINSCENGEDPYTISPSDTEEDIVVNQDSVGAESRTDTLIDAIISLAGHTEDSDSSEPEASPRISDSGSPPEGNAPVIPPPLEFSDTTRPTVSPSEQPGDAHHISQDDARLSDCITNIDDILFDVGATNQPDQTSFTETLSRKPAGVEAEPRGEFSVDSFTGSTVEEFAEECFNSIESYSSPGGSPRDRREEEVESVFVNDIQEQELEELLPHRAPAQESLHGSLTHNSSDSAAKPEAKQHITTISVSAAAPSHAGPQPNVTNIFVSPEPPAKTTPTDALTSIAQVENISGDPYVTSEGTELAQDLLELSPVFSSSAIISAPEAIMSGQNPPQSATLTTIGVPTKAQNGQEEEFIQPMAALKNADGKIFVVQKTEPSASHPDDSKHFKENIADDFRDALATLKFSSKTSTADAADDEEPDLGEEEEIVPEKSERFSEETLLNTLKNWRAHDTPPRESSVVEEAVTHFRMVKSHPPKNATVVHTLGIAGTGLDDEMIQPMFVSKDHQGKSFFAPLPETEFKQQEDVHEVDDVARGELASIVAKLAAQPTPSDDHTTEENEAEEEDVVPVIIANGQKEIFLSHLNNLSAKDEVDSKPESNSNQNGGLVSANISDQWPPSQDRKSDEPIDSVEDMPAPSVNGVEEAPATEAGVTVEGEEIVRASSVVSVQSTPKHPANPRNSVTVQEQPLSPTEAKKSEGFLSAVRTFESGTKEQTARQLSAALKPRVKESADVQGVVSKFENPSSASRQADHVALRPKATRSTDFRAKMESFQENAAGASRTFVSSARPKSLIEVSSSPSSGQPRAAKVGELRKSFNADTKLNAALRPHSSLRPLSVSTVNTRRISTGGIPLSGGMFSGSRSPRAQLPRSRQDDGSPFQVDVLKGILGLGLKVKVLPEGQVKVIEVQKGGPIDKDGQIRTGDHVLSINSTELTGQSEVRVQQIIRLLPRGLVKLVVSSGSADNKSSKRPQELAEDVAEEDLEQDSVTSADTPSTHSFILSGTRVDQVSSSDEAGDVPRLTSLSDTNDGFTPQPPLTARVEISSANRANGQQLAAPVKIAIKPTPTPRPASTMAKALAPRSPKLAEVVETPSSEEVSPREWSAAPRLSQRLHATDSAASSRAGQSRGPSVNSSNLLTGVATFKNNRDMFEQKSSTPDNLPLKPKVQVRTNAPEFAAPNSDLVTQSVSEAAESTSASDVDDCSPKMGRAQESLEKEVQDTGENVSETLQARSTTVLQQDYQEKPEVVAESELTRAVANPPENRPVEEETIVVSQSPAQKTPPPVAPKPRLSSSSSTKSDGNEESEDAAKAKTGPKISSGYERLQAITKSSKPSKIIEKSRAFVSSKAKMFDAKSEEGTEGASRRISVGGYAQQDGRGSSINTSLKPMAERRKSTGSGFTPKPITLTQQFSAAPKPNARSLSSTAKRPTDISIPETSPRDLASPDGKVKTVVSPTRLNSALSPRRASSVDSPTLPSVSFSPKQATSAREKRSTFAGDKSHSSSSSAREQSGIFKYTPVTVHGSESHRKTSPQSPTVPSRPSHQQNSTHSGISLTSPTPAHVSPHTPPSPANSSQISEEHLENTMKMFDDLLTDAPVVHTETDPVDLLLWAPVRKDSPRSPRPDSESLGSMTNQIAEQPPSGHPVAKPRLKPANEKPRDAELTLSDCLPQKMEVKEKQLVNVQNILENSANPAIENIVASQTSEHLLKQVTPDSKQTKDIQSILSGSNVGDNVVAVHVSEAIINIQAPTQEQSVGVRNVLSNNGDHIAENNLVATNLSKNMCKNTVENDRAFDVKNMLSSGHENSANDNIIAIQISNSISDSAKQISSTLEENNKEQNGKIFTEDLLNSLDDKSDENIVANNLSKEIGVDENTTSENGKVEWIDRNGSSLSLMPNGHGGDEGLYREHAQKIVEVVLANATTDAIKIEESPEDEAEEGTDLVRSEQGQDQAKVAEDEDEPPPLPGAPPPPLILRNPVLLVSEQDLLDQGGAPVVPEGFSSPSYSQNDVTLENIAPATCPDALEVNVSKPTETVTPNSMSIESGELGGRFEPPSTELASSADSVEPLNSTGGSVSDGESHRMANSRSPDDMLSEDSGMPADEEFQEGATDDAISPPGEFAETEIAAGLKALNSTSLSPTQTLLADDGRLVAVEQDAPAPAVSTPAVDDYEDVPPPLPTTSQPLIVVQSPPSVELEVPLSQTFSQDLSSPPSSQEATSHGSDGVPAFSKTQEVVEEDVLSVQQTFVSQAQPTVHDNNEKDKDINSIEVLIEPSIAEAKDFPDSNTNPSQLLKESVSSEGTDVEDVSAPGPICVTSHRKWTVRSNCTSPSPVVQADAGVTLTLAYTEAALTSALPPDGLAALLDKANGVLDTAQASPDLALTVVHLCRQGDSRELGVDLKHDGGIWFRVSRVQEGSPAKSEGGVQEGDWLLAVDSLWCDQVSMMRLLARLTKPKRDSVLVIARGERIPTTGQDTVTSRPTPASRPRSSVQSVPTHETNDSQTQLKSTGQNEVTAITEPVSTLPDTSNQVSTDIPPSQTKQSVDIQDSSVSMTVNTEPPSVDLPAVKTIANSAEVKSSLGQAESAGVKVTKVPSPIVQDSSSSSSSSSSVPRGGESSSEMEGSETGIFKVVMLKGATGVGFCLEGGKGSPKGDMPIIIKRIFKGGPAEKCGQLKVKDEILEVNGVDFQHMRHYEAWNHLKFLDDGAVCITVRRSST